MGTADIVIIGGGVVGCAIARHLSEHWENIFVLERMPRVGMGASCRAPKAQASAYISPKRSVAPCW